jgi:hypothetical protein
LFFLSTDNPQKIAIGNNNRRPGQEGKKTGQAKIPNLPGERSSSCLESLPYPGKNLLTRDRFHLAGAKFLQPPLSHCHPFPVDVGFRCIQAAENRVRHHDPFFYRKGNSLLYKFFSSQWAIPPHRIRVFSIIKLFLTKEKESVNFFLEKVNNSPGTILDPSTFRTT